LALQQRARSKSHLHGNAGKQIPGLTRQSGIIGKRNPLFHFILGPVTEGNASGSLLVWIGPFVLDEHPLA